MATPGTYDGQGVGGGYTAPPSKKGQYATQGAAAGFGASKVYSTLRSGRERQAMAKRNARIIEQDAMAADAAMRESGRRLADDQRDLKARQRMSVSGRGGLMGGTDLLTLADEAEKMQLDQLEIVRQRDINKEKSLYDARMQRYQGKQAKYKSRWTAALGVGEDIITIASMGAGGGGQKGGGAK
jgi:hypothetical protein